MVHSLIALYPGHTFRGVAWVRGYIPENCNCPLPPFYPMHRTCKTTPDLQVATVKHAPGPGDEGKQYTYRNWRNKLVLTLGLGMRSVTVGMRPVWAGNEIAS